MEEHRSDGSISFRYLKESIGSLMFLWYRLDDALSDALLGRKNKAPPRLGGSFHDRLVKLKALADREHASDPTSAAKMYDLLTELDHVRRQRNLIVHSLAGVCADPAKGEPHLTCEKEEGRVRITQTELSAMLETMDRCRQQLEELECPNDLARKQS